MRVGGNGRSGSDRNAGETSADNAFRSSPSSTISFSGTSVAYNGNETALKSYSDIDLLFTTNLPGSSVFGAISDRAPNNVDFSS